jgi:ABC-2 type transport system permease protein
MRGAHCWCVQIAPDFERRLLDGAGAEVQVIADGRNSNTAGTALGYLSSIVEQFNMLLEQRSRTARRTGRDREPSLVQPQSGNALEHDSRHDRHSDSDPDHDADGDVGGARARAGYFRSAAGDAFHPYEIMAGKALPSMFVGTIQATGVLLVAQLWFRIPFAGSYLTLYAGLLLFLLAAIGIGLLLSSVAATMQQAMLYSMLLIMPFSLLSGLTTPLSNMPRSLQYFTALNPLRYAIDIARRVYLEGRWAECAVPDLWPLALIAAVTLAAASWMFSHRMQ